MANRVPTALRDEMFAVYAERQTIESVSAKCGVHHATARRYKLADRWDERLGDVRAKAQREADYTLAAAMAQSLALIRVFKEKLSTAISAKNVKPSEATIVDLERLVRLEAYVLGAAESRHEVIGRFNEWTETELEHYARTGERPTRTGGGAA